MLLPFAAPLHPGRLIRRYKRFLADVALETATGDGATVTAHCPNSGAMRGLDTPGFPVWLSYTPAPHRKLPWTLEMVETPEGGLVGINTQHPNRLAAAALQAGRIPELAGYAELRREVPYGERSRIDLYLSRPQAAAGANARPCVYVEIKNVHLRRLEQGDGRTAEFPDCPTARGARHLRELMGVVSHGMRGVLLFVVQRNDCLRVRAAADLDPAYAAALGKAAAAGVEVLAYEADLSLQGLDWGRALPVEISTSP